MMRLLSCSLALISLTACAEVQKATDDVARQGARAAIDEVLVTQFPTVNGSSVTPYTDCVIDNASAGEIGQLARAALVGVDSQTIQLVTNIAQRPQTLSCFVQTGLALNV